MTHHKRRASHRIEHSWRVLTRRNVVVTHSAITAYRIWQGWPPTCSTPGMVGGFNMRLSSRTLMLAFVLVILGTELAYAQKKNAETIAPSTNQLAVLSTAVDRVNQTLTIQGVAFGS